MGDEKIISEIQSKNEKVFEETINKYSRLLWRIAANVLSGFSVCEIEECIADVFITLWEHPERYDPSKGRLSTWLCMVTRSRAIDRLRKLAKMKEIPTDDIYLSEENNSNECIYSLDDSDRLSECIEKLPVKEREAIVRRYYREEKNPEIARAMHLSSKQLENLLYSAKKKLRTWLS